jgi:hypothetical protein
VRSVKITTTVIREPLQDFFFATADRAMRDAGWIRTSDVPYVIGPIEGRYFRALDGVLASVATLEYDGLYDDPETRERRAEASVGVTFPAAERVLSALDAPWNVTIAEDAGFAAGGPEFRKRIRREGDVEAAVAEAVALIEAGAPRVAEEVPDVDALLAALLDDPGDDTYEDYKHPAILAAAGRTGDAQRALERYRGAFEDPEFDAYCDRFDAFLRAGATVPPPSEDAFREMPQPTSTTMRFGWGDIKPGHRLAVVGLMFRLLARRIVHRPDRTEPGD